MKKVPHLWGRPEACHAHARQKSPDHCQDILALVPVTGPAPEAGPAPTADPEVDLAATPTPPGKR